MFRRRQVSKKRLATPENGVGNKHVSEDPRLDHAMQALGSFADALSEQLAKDEVSRGLHVTKELTRPTSNNFGIFVKSWNYTKGCEPLDQLDRAGAGVIGLIALKSDGTMTRLMLGRTPAEAYKDLKIRDDGTAIDIPGEYAMILTNSDEEFDNVPQIYYFEKQGLADIRFEVGIETTIPLSDGQSLDIGRIDIVQALI